LFQCNLACAGCGKSNIPARLGKRLTPQQCFDAVEECGAPMVSIPGGEPLIHPEIKESSRASLPAKSTFISAPTRFFSSAASRKASSALKYLTFSIHLDGQKEEHDTAVCRDGTYDTAVEAIKLAVKQGFRVCTNTTLFNGANAEHVRAFFDDAMDPASRA